MRKGHNKPLGRLVSLPFLFKAEFKGKKNEDLYLQHCHGPQGWLAAPLQMATGMAMGHLCSDFFFPRQMAVTSLVWQESPCLRALSRAGLLFGIIWGGGKVLIMSI